MASLYESIKYPEKYQQKVKAFVWSFQSDATGEPALRTLDELREAWSIVRATDFLARVGGNRRGILGGWWVVRVNLANGASPTVISSNKVFDPEQFKQQGLKVIANVIRTVENGQLIPEGALSDGSCELPGDYDLGELTAYGGSFDIVGTIHVMAWA